MADTTCYFSDCDRPSFRAGLCYGHRKQQQRGRRLTELRERVPHSSRMDRLMDGMCLMAGLQATDDEGWRKARDRVRKAALAYAIECVRAANGGIVHGMKWAGE